MISPFQIVIMTDPSSNSLISIQSHNSDIKLPDAPETLNTLAPVSPSSVIKKKSISARYVFPIKKGFIIIFIIVLSRNKLLKIK